MRRATSMHTLVTAGLILLLSGCSDDSDAGKDSGNGPDPDRGLADLAPRVDQDPLADGQGPALDTVNPANCAPLDYPSGPFGTRTGNVAANLEFLGFQDPLEHCKLAQDKEPDTTQKVKISFKDWYQGNCAGDCAQYRKKLLLVMVSAGWCPPCMEEVAAIQAQYEQGKVEPRLGVLNIVFQDAAGLPVDEAFLKSWIAGRARGFAPKLTYPVVMDPSFKMGLYFNEEATPFNMLVDLETMTIYFQQVGADFTKILNAMTQYFNTH